MARNPWDQKYGFLWSRGEFAGMNLRVWQWILLPVILLPLIVMIVAQIFGVFEFPFLLYIGFMVLFVVLILIPDGKINGFLDWLGRPYLLRRADQDLIDEPLLRPSSRIIIRVINSLAIAWLVFFKDFKIHLEADLAPAWGIWMFTWVSMLLLLRYVDREWVVRRSRFSVLFAIGLLGAALFIIGIWWWVFTGRSPCPNWVPIGICPQ